MGWKPKTPVKVLKNCVLIGVDKASFGRCGTSTQPDMNSVIMGAKKT